MGDFSALAYRIKNLRQSLGMTQREFAKEAGCTAATLSAYENGSKSPSLEIVKGIAEAFDVSIDWLCGLSERPNGSNAPQTYSDIIFMLSEIDSRIELCLEEKHFFTDRNGFQECGCAVNFVGYEINSFLSDWAKYRNLRNAKTIDADIYNACMSKLYTKSNFQLPVRQNTTDPEE